MVKDPFECRLWLITNGPAIATPVSTAQYLQTTTSDSIAPLTVARYTRIGRHADLKFAVLKSKGTNVTEDVQLKAKRPTRRVRGLVFRIAAILLGFSPFVLAEAILVALDWGRPDYSSDPFVGFHDVQPLFVPSEDGTRYEISPSRQGFFRPDSFSTRKPDNEYRIFCLGGSTVQGRPFGIETSFTTWLELALQAADATRKWEVVNCGGVSYASYRLVPVLDEVLGYRPDLIVVYTGHNEFLEDRTYRQIKRIPKILARPCGFLARTRTSNLLRQGYVRLKGGHDRADSLDRPTLRTEVDAMLEYEGGLAQYHRDDKWRRDVIQHYRYNLRRMVELCRDAGVEIILVNPVSNLRDCPPFKNQHRDGLTPEELKRWEGLIGQAAELQATNMHQATLLLEEAVAIDDRHAGTYYLLAKCCDALGDYDRARRAYIRAKDEDICPLRILEPMNQAVLEVARQTGTTMADVRAVFAARSDAGIPGGVLLVDHVHPSFEGHRLIADVLLTELARQGIVRPVPGWKERRDQAFRAHFESLDGFYFVKGQETLEVLRCWTQGKASQHHSKLLGETRESGP